MVSRGVLLLALTLLLQEAVAMPAPAAPLCSTLITAEMRSIRQQLGDDPRWAAPDWDDTGWAPGNNVPARSGIRWVRFRFALRESQPNLPELLAGNDMSGLGAGGPIDGIYMAAPYSYEIYWDGRLLGGSGVVSAHRETEVVGPLDKVWVIPGELLGPGEHVVAIRFSSFHYNFPAERLDVVFLLSNVAGHAAEEIKHLAFPMLGVGGATLVALLSLLLYLMVDRWRPLLLCSLSSFALALFYLLIACRWLRDDPYDWFYPRLLTITCVMVFIAWIFPWLLLEQFALRRRAWWLGVLTGLLGLAWAASPFYEFKTLWLCRAMLAMSVAIAAWAIWQRRPGAWFVLAAAVAGLWLVEADRRDFLNQWFFNVFSLLVLYVFALVGLQLRADRRRAQTAVLTTARLETELLKKNLQPHFLLNTLTAVSEVIEQDPHGAVKFINDLAAEFRSLALMSGERLVPLQRELDLCHAHLKVISRRTGRKIGLQTAGVANDTLVPPALFLTLIENGLVHQQVEDGADFTLSGRQTEDGVAFSFRSPGRTREQPGRVAGGTGLRYVRARLEESFPGGWVFSQGPATTGWETVIEWRTPAASGRPA